MKTGRETRPPIGAVTMRARRPADAAPADRILRVASADRWIRRVGWTLVVCALFLGVPMLAAANQFVRLDYNLTLQNRLRNTVFIEIFDDRPLSRDNFMQYVNGGLYDGTFMHRLARNFVLQGGGFYPLYLVEPALMDYSLDPTNVVDLDGDFGTSNPTVLNEVNNTPFRSNLYGTIAMAKVGPPPGEPPTPETINSATDQWFVNLNDNTSLDAPENNGGFTVFAEVVGDGMNYFEALNNGLPIYNLNPDYNDDGVRDGGPFYNYQASPLTDGVPRLGTTLDNLVILNRAARIDYFGEGSTTDVPASGKTFTVRDAFIDTGAVFTGTGRLIVNVDRTMGIREGTVLTQRVLNLGTVEPGAQIGMITVPEYEQRAEGTLRIDLRGTTVDTGYDRISVTGSANLDGTLKAALRDFYYPFPGSQFTVLTGGSITGSFATYDLPELAPNMFWSLSQTASEVTLIAAGGDYDHNGVVNAADYVVWRDSFGDEVGQLTGADGNGDFLVDAADFTIWRDNMGRVALDLGGSAAGSAAAVPEPESAWLIILAGALLGKLPRRR